MASMNIRHDNTRQHILETGLGIFNYEIASLIHKIHVITDPTYKGIFTCTAN